MQIKMSRAEFTAAQQQLKGKFGVDLPGDTGTITHSGVTLGYAFTDSGLDVEIQHKPFYVTTSYVQDQIQSWFAGQAANSTVATSAAACVALLLCCSMFLTGCTVAQQANVKLVMQKVISYEPEVQIAEDSLASTVALFVPGDAALIQAGQGTFDAAKAVLIVAANAYIATPNAGTLASVRTALENVLSANQDQFLAAAKISNPVSLALAKTAIVAVREVLLLMDGALQTTQTTATNVATAQARMLKLKDIAPWIGQSGRDQVEQATGHSYRVVYAYETSLGY